MNVLRCPPSRPSRRVRPALIGAVVMLSLLTGCARIEASLQQFLNTDSITSKEGDLRMRVPKTWQERSDLNPSAVLQAGNRQAEAYAVVVVDPREFFDDLTLGKFADIEIQRFLDTVAEPELFGPQLVLVDGHDALQYEIRGIVDGQNVVYLFTVAETEDRFLKIVTWSLASRYDENAPDMQVVTSSVRELEPLGDVLPSPDEPDDGAIPNQPTPLPSIDRGDRD